MVSQRQSIHFPLTIVNGIHLVQLPTHLTVVEAVAFRSQCKQLVQQNPTPRQIILDLGLTTFIDSSGIGSLVSCLRSTQAKQIELILWSVHPEVRMALSLADLDELLKIEPATQALVPTETQPSQTLLPTTHPSVRSQTKRLLDIVGAIVGLGITALLFIPIVIAIKLDSPGPIFFRQMRCGWMGKRFKLWKFRSMVTDAEALKSQIKNEIEGPMFKNAKDPRVTRVGRILRKTSLDELPQFWNVLKGDMSLVGTRPPTPNEIDCYEVPNWQRLDVKPGMTGEWQVNGRSQVSSFEDVIRLDLRYQERWSLAYDLKLIVQTILVLFSKNKGAF
ncbi:MAG: anti-sigma factor antagonist [Leptolyngbyaceae cyanobacterium SU_3_3]|nr:anti-sigma factor antagonist [Leptolyngbyaceae cyanobacterium SU_3_3]NJR50572.1 anti-sigma factor antagonist [Leptolyngbyaceae cyanobacterium CSU_1_3]